MNRATITIDDVNAVIDDIRTRYSKLSRDDIFVLWFLRAYLTDSEDKAADAVAGGARDKGIDALLIDDGARAVIVVQAKLRQQIGKSVEKRADIISLAEVARRLNEDSEKEFQEFIKSTEALVGERLKQARQRVLKHDYKVWLYFVTLGKVTESTRRDAESFAKSGTRDTELQVIDGKRAIVLVQDYLDGVAPPIPSLELEMEEGENVTVNGVSQRFDKKNRVEAWVFSMRGDNVAQLFQYAGVRLFARNIRGYLGENTAINKGMRATLQLEPDRFFYYNNGITILCDRAFRKSHDGRDYLHVNNPQVINGQQTTRTLANSLDLAKKASVLVKVIQVEHRGDDATEFDRLLARIVQGTNWQNEIKPSDLMANDRVQVDLERSLRKIGYAYIRKRQTKGEIKRNVGAKHLRVVTKDEFAQVVAACDVSPIEARVSKEELFDERLYDKVFPSTEPEFYLCRYALHREVVYASKRDKRFKYLKWLVLNFIWGELSSSLGSLRAKRNFRRLWELQRRPFILDLNLAITKVFESGFAFYRANKGKGEDEVDLATFSKRKSCSSEAFLGFWQNDKTRRAQIEKLLAKVIDGIKEEDG